MVINKTTYNNWIRNDFLLNAENSEKIFHLCSEYPYFQTNQILFAKTLLNINSINFDNQIKIAAAYATSRKKLFDYINLKHKTVNNTKDSKSNNLIINQQNTFSQWIKIAENKIEDQKFNSLNSKINLIEKFISKDKQLDESKSFFSATKQAKKSIDDQMNFVTETLAKVYLEQEHYSKAKLAYEKLSLKYPEKSSFFAGQIKLINKKLNLK